MWTTYDTSECDSLFLPKLEVTGCLGTRTGRGVLLGMEALERGDLVLTHPPPGLCDDVDWAVVRGPRPAGCGAQTDLLGSKELSGPDLEIGNCAFANC